MATKKRAQSETGFYHVMQRGVNHFDIFEDDEDRSFFVERMVKYMAESNVQVLAWCLMSNHTHLLIRCDLGNLVTAMRQLGAAYARHFNYRHQRSGPLFEGRFASVCIESEEQLLACVRYIHRNPIRHEETTLLGSYRWSSYGEYLSGTVDTCDTGFISSLFSSLSNLIEFHEMELHDETHLDLDTIGPLKDDRARELANAALERAGFGVGVSGIGTLARELRNKAIAVVFDAVGCSLRQLQRLTSIPYSAIRVAVANCAKLVMDKLIIRKETGNDFLSTASALKAHGVFSAYDPLETSVIRKLKLEAAGSQA